MPSTYDTATQSFRQAKPLPLPLKKGRVPKASFGRAFAPARPFVRDPDEPIKSGVKFPKGVSNGKY